MLQHSQATKRFAGQLPQMPSPPMVQGRRRNATLVSRQPVLGAAYTHAAARLAPSQFVHVEGSMPMNNSHVINDQDGVILEPNEVVPEMINHLQEMITDLKREVTGLRLDVNDLKREFLEVQMVWRFTDAADPAVGNPTATYQPI